MGKLLHRGLALKRLLAPGVQAPVYALVFVTNKCNAGCEHCFYWRELNQGDKDELTLAEYQQLATNLGPLLQVTLTGGSPELRKDLAAVTKIFVEKCKPANITFCMLGFSTGLIVKHLEQILKDSPKQRFTVAISLDGLAEEHDKLRKLPGCFDRVCQTINEVAKLKQHYRNIRIAVGMTVHALNYQNVEASAAWVRRHLPIDLLKPILVRGDPYNRDTLDRVCVASYLDVVDQDREWLQESSKQAFSAFDFLVSAKELVQRRIISDISKTGKVPLTCSGGRETVVIRPNGDVLGCELREATLGNLRNHDLNLQEIWLSSQADLFRKTSGAAAECSGCYHHCFLSPPILRSAKIWPELLAAAWSIYRGQERGISSKVRNDTKESACHC